MIRFDWVWLYRPYCNLMLWSDYWQGDTDKGPWSAEEDE